MTRETTMTSTTQEAIAAIATREMTMTSTTHEAIAAIATRIILSVTPSSQAFGELAGAVPMGWSASLDADDDGNPTICLGPHGDEATGGVIAKGDHGIAFYPFSGGEDYDVSAGVADEIRIWRENIAERAADGL